MSPPEAACRAGTGVEDPFQHYTEHYTRCGNIQCCVLHCRRGGQLIVEGGPNSFRPVRGKSPFCAPWGPEDAEQVVAGAGGKQAWGEGDGAVDRILEHYRVHGWATGEGDKFKERRETNSTPPVPSEERARAESSQQAAPSPEPGDLANISSLMLNIAAPDFSPSPARDKDAQWPNQPQSFPSLLPYPGFLGAMPAYGPHHLATYGYSPTVAPGYGLPLVVPLPSFSMQVLGRPVTEMVLGQADSQQMFAGNLPPNFDIRKPIKFTLASSRPRACSAASGLKPAISDGQLRHTGN
jgi:hypothetical protein